MNISNRLTKLLGIEYPIIQAGMVWVSGWKLASAVSNNGGLGLIGSGSMKPELLREHIRKCNDATSKPFGINIPLLRGDADDLINITIEENIKIVFTSAGNPAKFIEELKKNGITIVHVVPSVKHGIKAESVGCDAIVGEGVEAGGHNGLDEITTFSLIPQLADAVNIPVIAAGGITDGRCVLAALALGAEGVQIGTRFAATIESSAHDNYKQSICNAKDNSTMLVMKKLGMARIIKNQFGYDALNAETRGDDIEKLKLLLGEKRERKGIFEGDTEQGMMEAGQGAGLISDILSVEETMNRIIAGFDETIKRVSKF
ncbi:NAD(P)H-dependent flavin oxidoreductase [Bacteroidota bacterium]